MNTTLVSTRADARESLLVLRRMEAKLDSVAHAVLGLGNDAGGITAGSHAHVSALPAVSEPKRSAPGASGRSDVLQTYNAVESTSGNGIADTMKQSDRFAQDNGFRPGEVGEKLAGLELQLTRITDAMGIKERVIAGDDKEDRKRLKEKLTEALENERRNRVRDIVSEREVWQEYLFGICSPDRRNGKRGNRYVTS
jgi:hypothetical protein